MFWEVKPGVGLGPLIFGDSQEEVEQVLGPPEEIDKYKILYNFTIAWYYWSLELSAHFDECDDYILEGLNISNPAASLRGVQFIGLEMGTVLEMLSDPQWGEISFDEDPDWPSVHLDDLGVTINFKDGYAESIQIRVLFDENEEDIWPER